MALAIALLTLSMSEIETLNRGLKVTEYVHVNMLIGKRSMFYS